jgi:hypothetical protein
MENVFSADGSGMAAFAAANHAAAATTSDAGSADPEAMFAAATVALGAVAGEYLAAYAPAQAHILAATKHLAQVHHEIGCRTQSSWAAFYTADGAVPPPHPPELPGNTDLNPMSQLNQSLERTDHDMGTLNQEIGSANPSPPEEVVRLNDGRSFAFSSGYVVRHLGGTVGHESA